jgi:hypothetical protein
MKTEQGILPNKMVGGTLLPDSLMDYPGLKAMDKLLYLVLAKFIGPDGQCFPSHETLAKKLSCTTRQVRTSLDRLQKKRLIGIKRSDRNKSNFYIFYEHEAIVPVKLYQVDDDENQIRESKKSLGKIANRSEGQKSPLYINIYTKGNNLPENAEPETADLEARQVVLDYWIEKIGDFDGPEVDHRLFAEKMLGKKSVTQIKNQIDFVAKHSGEQYFPSIGNFKKMFEKQVALKDAFTRSKAFKKPDDEEDDVKPSEETVVYRGGRRIE